MSDAHENGSDSRPLNPDTFKIDCACVLALSEALQCLPSLIHAARGMINGLTRPTSTESVVWARQIGELQEWIFEGRPSVHLVVPEVLLPLLIAIRKDPPSTASADKV